MLLGLERLSDRVLHLAALSFESPERQGSKPKVMVEFMAVGPWSGWSAARGRSWVCSARRRVVKLELEAPEEDSSAVAIIYVKRFRRTSPRGRPALLLWGQVRSRWSSSCSWPALRACSWNQPVLSIRSRLASNFGLYVNMGSRLPVTFGAASLHLGHALLFFLALLISTPIALGIAIFFPISTTC